MIPFERYIHLRCCRRTFLSTNRLDTEVLLWWVCGWAVYAGLLILGVRPLSQPKDHMKTSFDYEQVRGKRFYDWHNCNPIKVLLSHCKEGSEPPITPFEIG